MSEYFTKDEAVALRGRRYRCTAGYSGVPAGTVGVVGEEYESGDGFGVDVRWEASDAVLVDGFSKTDLFLVFTDGPNAGRRAMVPDMADGGPLSVAEEPDTWKSLALEAASIDRIVVGVGLTRCAFCLAASGLVMAPEHNDGCLVLRVRKLAGR